MSHPSPMLPFLTLLDTRFDTVSFSHHSWVYCTMIITYLIDVQCSPCILQTMFYHDCRLFDWSHVHHTCALYTYYSIVEADFAWLYINSIPSPPPPSYHYYFGCHMGTDVLCLIWPITDGGVTGPITGLPPIWLLLALSADIVSASVTLTRAGPVLET